MKKGISRSQQRMDTFNTRLELYWEHVHLKTPQVSLATKYKLSHQSVTSHIYFAGLDSKIILACNNRLTIQKLGEDNAFN